jgi:chemotaxis response regulator CheB
MAFHVIHPQQSLSTFVKKILETGRPNTPIYTYKIPDDINENNLKKEDIIFFLAPTIDEQAKKLSLLRLKSIIVGHGEKICGITPHYNIDKNLLDPSKIMELSENIEKILYNVEHKIMEVQETPVEKTYASKFPKTVDLIIIGVSTGGPAVLSEFLKDIQASCIPILIAQHLPKGFSSQLSDHLQIDSKNKIVEVSLKTKLNHGTISIAQAGFDIEVIKEDGHYYALRKNMNSDPFHPSVDRLFSSASELEGDIASIILTGMGKDGTQGCAKLKQNNKFIIAQNLETCAVDGMPRSVIESGFADAVLSPKDIVSRINIWCRNGHNA